MEYYKYTLYRYDANKRDYFRMIFKMTITAVERSKFDLNIFLKDKINQKMVKNSCKPSGNIEVVKQKIKTGGNYGEVIISEDRYDIEG